MIHSQIPILLVIGYKIVKEIGIQCGTDKIMDLYGGGKMKLFLLYYFTKDFKRRKYAYVPGYDIDDAWERAKEMYGEECLQVMS